MLATTLANPNLAWAQTAAGIALHRLEELRAELDAALPLLDAGARATDWQSRAADAFHDDLMRVRDDVARLRERVADTASTARGARVVIASLEGGQP